MEREEQRVPCGGAAAGSAQARRALPGWRETAQATWWAGWSRTGLGPKRVLRDQLRTRKYSFLILVVGLAISK